MVALGEIHRPPDVVKELLELEEDPMEQLETELDVHRSPTFGPEW